MSEQLTVFVTLQIESLSEQVVRARPLGPWKIQAVGASPQEVCQRLQRRLEKLLPKTLPSQFFEGALPPSYEHWRASVPLKPQERNLTWTEPVQIELDSFRWLLGNGQCVVRVPAVGCTLFGRPEELHDAEVSRQAEIALVRLAEDLNLLELRQRFSRRRYEYTNLKIDVPLQADWESQADRRSQRKKTSTLRATASDLTVANLQPVYALDDKVADLAEHFVGESPLSVLLVGPAGVGKTSLVHRMVMLRQELELGERKVWATSGARIVSGMSGLGMWQQRCAKLIRQAHATDAIVHLGSLYELMEAGKIDGQPGVASMVRSAIGRRRLLAIAECTPEQLAMIERDDPMLLRAFARLEVLEPTAEQALEVLRRAAAETHGQGSFSEQALEELHRLHSRFATYSALPATALRLMRTMQDHAASSRELGAEDVARAFAKQTGLPQALVDDSVKLDLQRLHDSLSANVIGQAEPVALIVNLIAALKARLVRPGRPLASLLFIGPTGVGKTEMAKAIARLLYSDTQRMIRIDMSEYSAPWSVAKLIGKPGEGDGTLTSPIREQPFSVVLLDEFEKADASVFDVLLQVLGEGRLTDSMGRLADFRNAVVIMTSNLGADSFRESAPGFGEAQGAGWREHFQREVRRFVRPEFLGRIDRIVPFQPLPKEVVLKIAERELELLRNRAGLKYSESTLEFEPSAIELLSEIGYQPKYGARPLRRAIEEHVTVPLADALSRSRGDSRWHFRVTADQGSISIDPEKRSPKTESFKETEAKLINSWQQLGAMARAARVSAPLRALENEMERNQRQNELLRKKLQTVAGPRRMAALKEDLLRGEAAVEVARRIRKQLFHVTDQIQEKQLDLVLRWYRNEPIDWAHDKQAGKSWLSRLRQVTEDVVQGRVADGDQISLIVTGPGKAQLDVLWRAYQHLASDNGWQVDGYLVRPYDPLLDERSAEYRKRVSQKKSDPNAAGQPLPALRLLLASNEENGEREIACDLFRVVGREDWTAEMPKSTTGFALQIRGEGVRSWLEDEHGTVHFFDSQATGAKRRIRLKVSAFSQALLRIDLPTDWQQPVASAERDPRRLFDTVSQRIDDSSGRSVSYHQGKASVALAGLIELEHEQALWRAIGYHGVPPEAQLHQEIEVPF